MAIWAFGAVAHAEALPAHKVRMAMAGVEALLLSHGIDVNGYATSAPPPVELVPSSDPSLRGNDGGYVDGRIYLSGEGMAACTDLTLLHELVHDATVKHRLFTNVANADVRAAFEALADAVAATAGQEPYLPGCLPRRRFDVDAASLAAMAAPTGSKSSAAAPVELLIPVFFTPGSARLSHEARALIEHAASNAMAGRYATIVLAEAESRAATPASARALQTARATAVQRFLRRSAAQNLRAEITQGDECTTAIALAPQPAPAMASAGVGRGLMAP